jgi:heme/copper-type cytochrome/quinol oxidase subunit 2
MSTLFAQTHKMLPSISIQSDIPAMKLREHDQGGLLLNTWLDLMTDLNNPTLAKTALKELVGLQGYLPEFGLYHPEQIAFNRAFYAYAGSEWVPFLPQYCTSPVDVKDWDYTARGAILAAATFDDTIDWDAMAQTPTGRAPDQVGPGVNIHRYLPSDETLDENLKVTRTFPPLTFDSRMIATDDLHTYHFRLLDTDEAVALPIGVTIRLLITSDDVLHSWAVPAFGVKVDAVPGRVNEYFLRVKYPGVYFGQCSEICGVNHAFMPISIRALEWDHFLYWWRTESLALYRRGSLDAPFSIEFNWEAFCSLADAVLKDLTCTHGFVGHDLHRLTQNALYDGGWEVSRYLVYRQMVASIAIHTCGLESYPMVYHKSDIELMVFVIMRAIAIAEGEGSAAFRQLFSPEYMIKHYRQYYIPQMDMPWDFDSAFGLERVSIFHVVRSYDSFFNLYGDRPAELLKPASFVNFYPPNSQNYSDWRKDFHNLPMPPMLNGELLPRGKYPTRGTMHPHMKEYMTRYGRNLREIVHNATRLKPDVTAYPLGRAQAQLEDNIARWVRGEAALAGRYSWPAGTQVEFVAPLGTEYYIKEGLYKKGDIPTMPASRFKAK